MIERRDQKLIYVSNGSLPLTAALLTVVDGQNRFRDEHST